MNNFYIKQLIITGKGKKTSSIVLKQGLNIIYGPSNTGKTYIVKCINYLFGSDKNPIDPATGYDTIQLIVNTLNGAINMARKMDTKKITVHSDNPSIESGEYDSKLDKNRYDKSISSLWLKLIGINNQVYIMKSELFKKQTLSWRTFIHMFFLDEHKIISEDSILLPQLPTGNTAAISCLLYLILGNDYGDMAAKEDSKTKEAKKNAVVAYINKELSRLTDRNNELVEQFSNIEIVDFDNEIAKIIEEISAIEQEISLAIERNQMILQQLSDNNKQLTECNVLLNRYEELRTQYLADVKRLNFIVDGEANNKSTNLKNCPFCDGTINDTSKNTSNYIEASKAEYKKIRLQLKDLLKAIHELEKEKSQLESESLALHGEESRIDQVVSLQLQPKAHVLEDKLTKYKQSIEIKKEMRIIKDYCISKTLDLNEVETEEDSNLKFKVKEYFDRTILDEIDKRLHELLAECHYTKLRTARFNKSEMDIVVNGQDKRTFGKGYCAFFNVIVSTVFARYLKEKGEFSPSLLIFDSPILSLKEADSAVSNSMKDSLFANLSKNNGNLQIIIVENEIPEIDYGNSNIINFTKDTEKGRYGLLYDLIQ